MARPVKVAVQTLQRQVALYAKTCAADGCGTAFEGPINRKYCSERCQRHQTYLNYRKTHGHGFNKTGAGVLREW